MPDERSSFQVRPAGMPAGHGRQFAGKAEKLKNPRYTLKKILKYMESNKWFLVITFFLCVITSLITIIGTRLNGYAVDNFIETGNISGLLKICIIMLVIYLVSIASTYFQNRFMVRIAQKTSSHIRKELYSNIQILPVKYFDTNSSGDLMSRLTNDVDNINMTLSQSITQLFSGIVTIIGMLIAMLLLYPPLLLVGMITLPIMFLLTRIIVARAQPYFISQQRELGRLNGYIEERISGQKITLLFGKEDEVREDFRKINLQLKRSSVKAQAISGILGPVNNMVNNLTYFIIAFFGAYFILKGADITVGIVFTFILYMRNFIQPINQILNTFNMVQSALAGAERVFEVMEEPKEQFGKIGNGDIKLRGEVVLKDVDFSYIEGKEILKNISIHAKHGDTVAIVGPTGSGKTTIVNLLTRFYDINDGEILIDGKNITTFDKRGLRKEISMVLQDTFLFSESVRENIRYGRLNASDDEVEKAAKIANAHQFIIQLPEGYDTILMDNGSNLSQGQRQLLAIARAVLARSSILILDEATSSIDTKTEREIQKALLHLMKDKTTFIIAHRLSTIKNADEIIVLNNGQIIEQGAHNELISKGGFYAELCQSQYKGIAI